MQGGKKERFGTPRRKGEAFIYCLIWMELVLEEEFHTSVLGPSFLHGMGCGNFPWGPGHLCGCGAGTHSWLLLGVVDGRAKIGGEGPRVGRHMCV